VRSTLTQANARAWKRALSTVGKAQKDLATAEEKATVLRALADALAGLPGTLPRELAEALAAALDAGDVAGAEALLEGAEERPAAWLAGTFFQF